MGAVKVSFSLPEELYLAAVARQKAFGYAKFSHYLQECVRAEVESRKMQHVRSAVYPEATSANLALNDAPPEPPTPRKRKKADPETN